MINSAVTYRVRGKYLKIGHPKNALSATLFSF